MLVVGMRTKTVECHPKAALCFSGPTSMLLSNLEDNLKDTDYLERFLESLLL